MTRIDAHIARHFWRDGEFASWQASEYFPATLLAWLKLNYAELVTGNRSQWIERPEGVVWLFFHDEREIHGRLATRLTACWIGTPVSNTHAIYTELKERDDLMQEGLLSVPVHAKVVHQQRSFTKPIVMMAGLLLLTGIGYELWGSSSTQSNANTEIQPSQPITHKSLVPKADKYSSPIHVVTPKEWVCTSVSKTEGFCFQKFISKKCNKSTRLSYNSWLRELKMHDRQNSSGWGCPQNLKTDSDFTKKIKSMDRNQQKIIIKFMKYGENIR